jgi:hypothetical protein
MLCEEFEDRLNAVLDERGRPECDAELRLHCELCPECRHVAAIYSALLDGFCALAAPAAPRDMAVRVLAELPVRPSGARRVALVSAALATAAGLLIVLFPLLRVPAPENPQVASDVLPKPALAARAAAEASLTSPSLESMPILQSLPVLSGQGQGDVYGELVKETGSGLATIVRYVPGIGGTRGIIDAESNSGYDEPAWAVQVSEGLRPVTDSVTDTLNLLWQTLPVADLASRS